MPWYWEMSTRYVACTAVKVIIESVDMYTVQAHYSNHRKPNPLSLSSGRAWNYKCYEPTTFERMSQAGAKVRLEDLDIKPYLITKPKMAGIESVFDLAISIPHQLTDISVGMD
jgi:hypothetical protein